MRLRTRSAPNGPIPNENTVAIHSERGLSNDAALDGTLTDRLNETGLLLGVTVAGVNVHVAPVGSVLCWHASVMASRGLPVLALRASEKVAVPPGEIVCGVPDPAVGVVAIVSGYTPETLASACETAVIVTSGCAGTEAGAV